MDNRLLRALPRSERRAAALDYLSYLAIRDGDPDGDRRTLSTREEEMARFEGFAPWTGDELDKSAFRRFQNGTSPMRQADPLMSWIVQIAQANEGEAWGVELHLRRRGGGGHLATPEARARWIADLEETYHSRIFASIVESFDLEFEPAVPPWPMRVLIGGITRLPSRAELLVGLAGEIIGAAVLKVNIDQAEELLADHNEFCSGVVERLDDVLVDELGHVAYLLSQMARVEMWLLRGILWVFFRVMGMTWAWGSQAEEAEIVSTVRQFSLERFPQRVTERSFAPRQLLRRIVTPASTAGR